MLRIARILLAAIFILLMTLLFLSTSETLVAWLGWMVKIQFLPAILAANSIIIIAIILATLIVGRLYCSIICPLGVFQDIIARTNRKKLKYSYSKPLTWLRLLMLCLLIVTFFAGIHFLVSLLEPYSTYGRSITTIRNLATTIPVDWFSLTITFTLLLLVAFLAWKNGRTYCNTICPIGTVLGFISRFSLFKIRIDSSKCNHCGLCARHCKASCINSPERQIDYSRCVTCGNCISKCKQKALSYRIPFSKKECTNPEKRKFLMGLLLIFSSMAKAKRNNILPPLPIRKDPQRLTPILPPGTKDITHFSQHCTACNLCVSACPSNILKQQTESLLTLMQPSISYISGYCRPECTRCSEVCPTGAILPFTREQKKNIKIGKAIWNKDLCLPANEGVHCTACVRHCPRKAISLVHLDNDNPRSPLVPHIIEEKCIGCGACENLCPVHPYPAIHIERINIQAIKS